MMPEESEHIIMTTEKIQIGLRLPDGQIIWPPDEYKGFPLSTPEQRAIILEVLKKTAGDLNFTEQDFIRHYGWTSRKLTTTQTAMNLDELLIDSPEAVGQNPPENKDERNERDDESYYSSTIYERPVGSST